MRWLPLLFSVLTALAPGAAPPARVADAQYAALLEAIAYHHPTIPPSHHPTIPPSASALTRHTTPKGDSPLLPGLQCLRPGPRSVDPSPPMPSPCSSTRTMAGASSPCAASSIPPLPRTGLRSRRSRRRSRPSAASPCHAMGRASSRAAWRSIGGSHRRAAACPRACSRSTTPGFTTNCRQQTPKKP